MQYLDLSKLKDDDIYLMNIEQEWRLIYKDTARLYSRKAGSSQDRMRILKDIVRFRATPMFQIQTFLSERQNITFGPWGFLFKHPNDSHRYSGSNYGKSHGDYEKLRSSSLNELSRCNGQSHHRPERDNFVNIEQVVLDVAWHNSEFSSLSHTESSAICRISTTVKSARYLKVCLRISITSSSAANPWATLTFSGAASPTLKVSTKTCWVRHGGQALNDVRLFSKKFWKTQTPKSRLTGRGRRNCMRWLWVLWKKIDHVELTNVVKSMRLEKSEARMRTVMSWMIMMTPTFVPWYLSWTGALSKHLVLGSFPKAKNTTRRIIWWANGGLRSRILGITILLAGIPLSSDRGADDYPMTSALTPNYRVANGYSKSTYQSSAPSPPVTELTMQASIPTTPIERAIIQRIAIPQTRVLRAAVGRKTISRSTSLQGVNIQRPNLPRATIHIATMRWPAILRAAIRSVKFCRAIIWAVNIHRAVDQTWTIAIKLAIPQVVYHTQFMPWSYIESGYS